jgi:hypothetical protein
MFLDCIRHLIFDCRLAVGLTYVFIFAGDILAVCLRQPLKSYTICSLQGCWWPAPSRTERGDPQLTDPDPNILKSAAAYLREVARRPDAGRRHRKQPKTDALRQYQGGILEANR